MTDIAEERTYTIHMKDGPLECLIKGAPPCLFCGQPVERPSSDGPLVCGPCDTVPANSAARDHFYEEITRYRLERLNREMAVHSGGYEHHRDFKAICALGSFRPKYVFFRNLRDNVGNPWILFQLLSAFYGAGNGPRIPEEHRGKFERVRAAWLLYGREYLEAT